MLNEKKERELAYVVKIDNIYSIEGADRVEVATVGGWRIMVKKGQFQPGDYAIYFEIDSKVPAKEPFMFLESKHFKIKTQKYFKGKVISQGLLMAFEDFIIDNVEPAWIKELEKMQARGEDIEHEFLTKALKITYSVEEDNKRKASSADKYKKMARRRPDIFKKSWARWFMKREWGKKLMFFFFGKKKDKKNGWPQWVVKTDEERVQNMPWILEDKSKWFATEKIDGTSTTFTLKKNKRKKEFYICSRNVVFDTSEKKAAGCYYDSNVYVEMAEKYNVEEVLNKLLDEFDVEFVTLQGETYGEGIQKRDYGMKNHDFMAFNLIFGYGSGATRRLNPQVMTDILTEYNIPCVPIVDPCFILPDTVDELLEIATGKSKVDGGMREGLVFRSEDGVRSFKAVSNAFLLKYHS